MLRPFRDWYAVFFLHNHEVALCFSERLGGLVQSVASGIHGRNRSIDGHFGSCDLLGTIEFSVMY